MCFLFEVAHYDFCVFLFDNPPLYRRRNDYRIYGGVPVVRL